MNIFMPLFLFGFHIAQGDIPCRIAHVPRATRLLAMSKSLGGICPIAVREVLYRFTS